MRSFTLTHTYDVPPRVLIDAMLHPDLNAFLEKRLPDLEKREELARTTENGIVVRRVRCVPVPRIPDVAKSVVKPEMIEWVEEARVDVERGLITVNVIPAGFRNVFSFKGSMRIDPTPAGGCVRRVDAELSIKMLVVGKFVEDYVIGLIRTNMEAEGVALGDFIKEHPAPEKHTATA